MHFPISFVSSTLRLGKLLTAACTYSSFFFFKKKKGIFESFVHCDLYLLFFIYLLRPYYKVLCASIITYVPLLN